MWQRTPPDGLGFIVLCPSMATHDVKLTLSSIRSYLKEDNLTCIIPPTKDAALQNQFKEFVPFTYRSKTNTIPSMINKGMKYTKSIWSMVIFAGTKVRSNLNYKLSLFDFLETDIVYPVTTDNMSFVETSFNGSLFNKKLFKTIGDFQEMENPEWSKTFWAAKALEAGCSFKGIVGLRVI